jgi:hypothetical protein
MQPRRLHTQSEVMEMIMNKLTIAVATIAFGALLASAPARADHGGGLEVRGNQCFIYGPTMGRDGRFGVWGACPQTASVAVAPTTKRRHIRHSASH